MNRRINEIAARWWASRFEVKEKREELRLALLKHLPPEGDWDTYNDYDPEGPLLAATREVVSCRGNFFSGDGLFPRKTGLHFRAGKLMGKDGYGGPWKEVTEETIPP